MVLQTLALFLTKPLHFGRFPVPVHQELAAVFRQAVHIANMAKRAFGARLARKYRIGLQG